MHTGNVQHLYIEMNAFLSLVVLTTDTLIGHMFKYLMTNTLSVFKLVYVVSWYTCKVRKWKYNLKCYILQVQMQNKAA